MNVCIDEIKINELLTRGVHEIIHRDALKEKLKSGKQLRVKLGIDPTSPNIHIGRSVPLLKLKDFQELGHQIVFIVGDFTGIIGDTSDKDSERPMLTKDEIDENKKNYYDQVGKILNIDSVEFRHNSEWLTELSYSDVGAHANLFSVADFIARDNIKRRLDAGKRVSLREILYPLMQGYDSVAVDADVELGGTDQRFNLLAGRTMQPHFDQQPQDIVMSPLINGTDGRKMSSSWGNTINLAANPNDMYGKVMSMDDAEIVTYFTVCTRQNMVEVEKISQALTEGANPRDYKMKLAREIVCMYHGADAAKEAEKTFIHTFQKGSVPEDVVEIERKEKETFLDALVREGIVESKNEIRRLMASQAVSTMETNLKLEALPEDITEPVVIKIGKRRFVKLLPT